MLDADGSTEAAMILGAALHGFATGYHMRAPAGSGCDFALRCWTAKGEIEPCAQAVLAAVFVRARAEPRQGRRYWLRGMTERSDPCYLDDESDFDLDLEWP